MKRMLTLPVAGLLFLFPATAAAGPKSIFDDGRKSAEWLQAYQVWGTATPDPQGAPNPDPWTDLFFRRARLGLRGQAYPGLDYIAWFAFDNLGKDPHTESSGAASNPAIQPWDAYFIWRLDSTWANLSFGLLLPQVGNELTQSPFAVPSLDVALTNPYVRDHLGLRPSGRETGIHLGGFHASATGGWAFGYNLGLFDAPQGKNSAPSLQWSPLATARLTATLGDPEHRDYRLSPDLAASQGPWGVTLSAFGAWQGPMDEKLDTALSNPYIGGFERNGLFGSGLIAKGHGLELDAEIDVLVRRFSAGFPARYAGAGKNSGYLPRREFRNRVWHVRGSYRVPLPGGRILEPGLAYGAFAGEAGSPLNTESTDVQADAGLNGYLRKDGPRILLHYVMLDGRGGGATRNDFLALGVQIAL